MLHISMREEDRICVVGEKKKGGAWGFIQSVEYSAAIFFFLLILYFHPLFETLDIDKLQNSCHILTN